jgi:Fe-S-cluster-containing dehydrogenase component
MPGKKAFVFVIDVSICNGCAHLLDDGWKEPRCVDACQTGALKFGDESEFKSQIGQAEVLKPEAKAGPRVYYLNITKKFVVCPHCSLSTSFR